MIVTDYDLAFCKHALYCIYDKLIDQSDTEYYCNVYSKDALFCYACGYHISIVVYNGQIRFTIDHSVSGRSICLPIEYLPVRKPPVCMNGLYYV